ncbi:MAG: hypothetical protein KBC50_00010 [Candidatus Pacebacteria bacterium]|nr:hypothetical protein [Candidatus Paceibacterota bacterium]
MSEHKEYTKEELLDIAKSGSDGFLKLLSEKKVDLSFLKDIKIARKAVELRYGISQNDFDAVDFVFWTTYFAERESVDLLVYPLVEPGILEDANKYIISLIPEEKMGSLKKHCENINDYKVSKDIRFQSMETLVQSLYFSQKISVMEKHLSKKDNPFLKMLRKIQNLRNHIAHGRLNDLIYEDYSLSSGEGQLKLITDLMNAAFSKT